MRRVLTGIGLLLLIVGCGTEAGQPTTNSAGTGAATATAPATTAPATAIATTAPTQAAATTAPASGGAPTVVATLETSGGIAGIMQRLVVWSDGKLELANDGSAVAAIRLGQASPEQIEALQDVVNRPEFKALGDQYLPKDTCCDFFNYVLTTDEGTITTMDGVDWPQPLGEALKLMFDLQALVTADK